MRLENSKTLEYLAIFIIFRFTSYCSFMTKAFICAALQAKALPRVCPNKRRKCHPEALPTATTAT